MVYCNAIFIYNFQCIGISAGIGIRPLQVSVVNGVFASPVYLLNRLVIRVALGWKNESSAMCTSSGSYFFAATSVVVGSIVEFAIVFTANKVGDDLV
jgi:hypothetical protein